MPNDKYENIWNEVWEKVKTYNNIDVDQINAFFSRLVPQAFSEGFLMLTADTGFIKTWVEKNFLHLIKQALEEIYGVPFNVAIEVDNTVYIPQTTSTATDSQNEPTFPTPTNKQTLSENNTTFLSQETNTTPSDTSALYNQNEEGFTSEYSFENFVVGSSNQLAYSMALAVAETPGEERLNPLFIYGKSGLGKTHLLRAIQNYIIQTYPYMKTIYIDTMVLVDKYAEASRAKNFPSFRKYFNDADMVLIDDVQGLQGKEGTVNIVFQIINELKEHGKQIVLSADRAPKHIDIDERYQSRFNSGGTCDIQPPEVETKLGITRNFIEDCKKRGELTFEINKEVQEYIAQNSSSNIRELKSAITKIILYGDSFNKQDITVEDVARILQDHFTGGNMRRVSVADIQKAVEQYYSISHADLVGKKRSASIVKARQMAIYLCRSMIDIPFASIGKEFNKDHTTIMYAVTQIEGKLKESRELNEEVEIIKQMVIE